MEKLFIPTEEDFRRWIAEALESTMRKLPHILKTPMNEPEKLLNRKEVAGIFQISLVTLHQWMHQGLPFHKQGGRVYFLRSEVMHYLKDKNPKQLQNRIA